MNASDAYLQAVRKLLRADTTLFPNEGTAKESCDITVDQRPFAYAGKLFIALFVEEDNQGTRVFNTDVEQVSIAVAITLRTSDTPYDRKGAARYSRDRAAHPAERALSDITKTVKELIHDNVEVIKEGNCYISEDEDNLDWPLLTTLYYSTKNAAGPQAVSDDHFHAQIERSSDIRSDEDTGLLMKLVFSGGSRYKRLR